MVEVLYERCCGLDVHQKTVVACLITPGRGGQPHKEIRTFGTMTADLLELADWLRAAACTQVAMEATGVYWQPIWNLLEEEFTLLLVNARHIKAVPGRKTDVKDCEWLADLLRHGLVRASFVPKRPQLERALVGTPGEHQRFLLAQQLAHIDFLDETLGEVSAEIAERLRPFDAALERLDAIPGVGRATAEVLLAEIGPDMSRFPSAAHLAAWAGMCPGNYESAGKRQKGKTRKGSKWLRAALLEAGQAAARTKETYLAAQYHRLVPRLGKKKAAVAVGHSI